MGRRRRRRRHEDEMNHSGSVYVDEEGKVVNIRKIGASDEGVLYTMQISNKRPRRKSKAPKTSCFSWLTCERNQSKKLMTGPDTNTLFGEPSSVMGAENAQFTIKKKKKYSNPILNWLDSQNVNFFNYSHHPDVDTHLYRPSNFLYLYINWTFTASFTAVFLSFLVYYFVVTIIFGAFLMIAGNYEPECIVSGGEHFGSNPYTAFNDAYELSWTTFTTVGYGNSYTSTANDLVAADGTTKAHACSWVVLLCNAEAFFGLLYAGMCGAILFGKVNRVQSHAKLIFANAVCLQYEEIEEEEEIDDETPSVVARVNRNFHRKWTDGSHNSRMRSLSANASTNSWKPFFSGDNLNGSRKRDSWLTDSNNTRSLTNGSVVDGMKVVVSPRTAPQSGHGIWRNDDEETPTTATTTARQELERKKSLSKTEQFVDQFNGCPVLKFQVVNEMCNREGSELVDAIMKVVGIKFKVQNSTITHSQYVRVNLVDFEHPFLSRVWHGVHILDGNSPLLTDKARRAIKDNKGSWPTDWFEPNIIREQLEFNDLIVTVAGISNVSALTVHAYKRYKIGDVLIGYNFAPLVFRDHDTGTFEVDMTLCHDVREQKGGECEDIGSFSGLGLERAQSTIRITKSKDSMFAPEQSSQFSQKSLLEMSQMKEITIPANNANQHVSNDANVANDEESQSDSSADV